TRKIERRQTHDGALATDANDFVAQVSVELILPGHKDRRVRTLHRSATPAAGEAPVGILRVGSRRAGWLEIHPDRVVESVSRVRRHAFPQPSIAILLSPAASAVGCDEVAAECIRI